MKPITEPNRENLDPDYWEMVLRSHGLSSRKGESPRKRIKTEDGVKKISLTLNVGGMRNLASVDAEQIEKESGKVKPDGSGPDR